MKHTKEVQEAIARLSRERPDYVEEARIRADTIGHQWEVPCPTCNEKMRILHIFLPLTPHNDPMIDSDFHIRCDNCDYEDWVSITGEAPRN